jgi:hypothetical protein
MEEILTRIWDNLIGRIDGPMKFRIILQPLVSLYFAYKAGRRDSKSGGVPYFIGLFTSKGDTKDLVKQGWKDVGKVFIVAIIIDIIYQLVLIYSKGTQFTFYPVETIITAIILAFIPYLIFRGIFNRIFRVKKNK